MKDCVGKLLAVEPYRLQDGVSQSMLQSFDACRKRAWYQLRGWQLPTTKVALIYGSLWHKLLETLYVGVRCKKYRRPKDAKRLLALILPPWKKRQLKEQVGMPKGREHLDLIEVETETLFPIYCEYWSTDFNPDRWLELEGKFDIRWHGYRLRGRKDGLQRLHKRERWLLETKTQGQRQKEEVQQRLLAFDFQNQFYVTAHEADKEDGCPVDGVTYNMIRKPQLKPKAGEDLQSYGKRLAKDVDKRPEFYFVRMEATYSPEELKRFQNELLELLTEFKMWRHGELATRRRSGACTGKFNCDFIEACATGRMLDYKRDGRLFEELVD